MRNDRYLNRLIFGVLLSVCILLSGCAAKSTDGGVTSNGEDIIGFSFIFMSDTQADPEAGDYTALGGLFELALSHESEPKLLILGGDNVNDGASSDEWSAFWSAAGDCLDDVLIASVAGNHDNKSLLAEQFDYPDKAPVSATEGFFYSFTESNVLFVMLDSNMMGAGNAADAKWLEELLSSEAAANADWIIAVSHHPFFPIAEIPKDSQRAQTMGETFLPLMEESRVDLLLCGHQHMYSRTKPMSSSGISEGGLVQIMTASGAKGNYTPGSSEYVEITAETPAYLIVEIRGEAMAITAYNGAGAPFDSVQFIKDS